MRLLYTRPSGTSLYLPEAGATHLRGTYSFSHPQNITDHMHTSTPAEGICIGIPVYFATGSKWKGVGWAAASGLTEPLGALIGLALQQTGHMDDITMGVILAMVSYLMH